MLEKAKQITTKQWIFLIGLAVVLFVTYNIVLAVTRIGEVKVSINVIPKDSKVTVNGKPSSKRTLYLSPASYTFTASAEGWKTDTQQVAISKASGEVYLLPSPESQAVQDFLRKNPKIQIERETLGGKRVALQNQEALGQNPILKYLPYTNDSPPFTIDYGPAEAGKGNILLLVSNSSPNGRQAAIDWIRQHGEDPTNMEIKFTGFTNMLFPGFEDADD